MGLWNDVQLGGRGRLQGSADPAFADINSTGIYGYKFTNGKIMYFNAQLPHRYKVGTPLKPHLHWVPDTTETYTGTWTLEYVWFNPVQKTPMSSKVTVTGAIAGAKTAWVPEYTNLAVMNQTFDISCCFWMKLSLALSAGTGAFLCEFDCHEEEQAGGSISEFRPKSMIRRLRQRLNRV
jgi:hypothetical protein